MPGMERGAPLCWALLRAGMGALQRAEMKAAGQGHAEGLGSNVPDRSCVNALQPSLPLTHTVGRIKDSKRIRERQAN